MINNAVTGNKRNKMFSGTRFSHSPGWGQRCDVPRCSPMQISYILFMPLTPSVPSSVVNCSGWGRKTFKDDEIENKVF